MARNQNIFNLIRGDKFDGPRVELTITNDDGSPKDMGEAEGTTVRSQIRDKVDGGEEIYDFTDSIVPDVSTPGKVIFTLTAPGAQTALWPVSQLYGDIEIFGPGDFGPYTFAKYVIKVEPDITQ